MSVTGTPEHPGAEADGVAVNFVEVGGEDGVGGRADEGGHAAAGRAVGDGEEQGGAEGARAGVGIGLGGQELHDGERDGQHHERGRGVAHPHAEEGGGEEEAGDDVGGAGADGADEVEGDAAVEVPLLHSERDDEAAEEEVDDGVGEGRGALLNVAHLEKRKEHEREERGGGQRDRLADPEDGHEQGDAGGAPAFGAEAVGGGEEEGGKQAGGAEETARELAQAVAGGLSERFADGVVATGGRGGGH